MVPPPGHGSAGKRREPSAPEQSSQPPAKSTRVITFQACVECRKKRAKCDGQQPCRRCQTKGNTKCVYDTTVRRSKEELRAELHMLQERQDSFDQLLAAVAEPGISDQVLGHLQTGHSPQTILSWIKEAGHSINRSSDSALFTASDIAGHQAGHEREIGLHETSSVAVNESYHGQHLDEIDHESQLRSGTNKPDYFARDTARFTALEETLWPLGAPTTAAAPETWTYLASDPNQIRHLMALYFCWEYPLFTYISREHFMDGFHNGRNRFCSLLLVNSILALGSCWDAQPMSETKSTNFDTQGDSFFEESVRLLGKEVDRRSLTTIQALGIMSMRELSRGRDVEARYYSVQSIRLAIDMGLHRKRNEGDWDLYYVETLTFWGAFSLDALLSVVAGTLPQFPFSSPRPPPPVVPFNIEQSPWMPYTGADRLSCLCELTERIYEALYTLYSPVGNLSAAAVLDTYTPYLTWYDEMPEALRLDLNSTPSVLVSHMCYHYVIIHLFHPFLDLQLIGSKLSPARICHQAADAIQGLLKSYSQLHSLRRTPVFVPFLAMASAISHLEKRIIDAPAPGSDSDTKMVTVGSVGQHALDALDRDITDLREMSGLHYSAVQAVGLIKELAKARKIEIEGQDDTIPLKDYYRLAGPYMHRISLDASDAHADEFVGNQGEDVQ